MLPKSIVTETELIASARAGSLEALGELYGLHSDAVYTTAYRMTGSRDDAADVLQDVFVGLPRALRSYGESGRFAGWLKRVTVRTALMRMRHARRKSEISLSDTDVNAVESEARPLDRIAIERAIAALPERLRISFMLREVEGYSHAEIADMLGISPENSATRVSRAWSMLRKAVER